MTSDASDARTASERETGGNREDGSDREVDGDRENGRGEDAGNESWGSAAFVERVVVAASVVLIAALLGFVLWQASVTPGAVDPHATVDAVEPIPDSDRERVTVVLSNDGQVGLESVEVVVACGGQERSLEFTHVPGGGRREGTVVCPAGSNPRATVETWIEA